MDEAVNEDPREYANFNEFFTRALKKKVRRIDSRSEAIVSPADGEISQIGDLYEDKILQIKGKEYNVVDLLGGSCYRALPFLDGKFITIYLSPKDYHRVHMPISGRLMRMVHVRGRLFSVNRATTNFVNNLFTRNERVVTIFDTPAGPMAVVLVGAIFVASIETVWHGVVTPATRSAPKSWNYNKKNIALQIGEELGRFNMGSTVVVLFGKDAMDWRNALQSGETIILGQRIGQITRD